MVSIAVGFSSKVGVVDGSEASGSESGSQWKLKEALATREGSSPVAPADFCTLSG